MAPTSTGPFARPVRLHLERLEDRLALSTVAAVGGTVFVVTADDALLEQTSLASTQLSPPGTIRSISAGTDAGGGPAVWAVAGDASFWEWTSNAAWAPLSPAGTIEEFNAAGGDVVFAMAADRSFWEHGPTGWAALSPPNTIQSFTPGLGDEVFVVAADGSFWRHAATGWEALSPAGTILNFAVGGTNDVFALASDHSLWEHSASGWTVRSPAATIPSLSGAAGGKAFAVAGDGYLWQYDASGWTALGFSPVVGQVTLSSIVVDHGEGEAVTPVVVIRSADGALWQGAESFGGTNWVEESPPGTILWAGATTAHPAGGLPQDRRPDLFAAASDSSVWELNEATSSGWVQLSPAGTVHIF